MELKEVIKRRRSTRKFINSNIITKSQIMRILESAVWAPSSGNGQAWHFIVIQNKKIIEEITTACFDHDWIKTAPLLIACCGNKTIAHKNYGDAGVNLYMVQDVAAAIQNMLLTITDLGLAACWVAAYNEEKVSRILKIEDHLKLLAIIPIGYAAEDPPVPERKNIEKVSKIIS